jgi:hypothetical protein
MVVSCTSKSTLDFPKQHSQQHRHFSTIASIESSFWCWTILQQPLDPYLTITWLWFSHITRACLKIQCDDYSSIFAWLLDDFTRHSHDCTWLFTFTEGHRLPSPFGHPPLVLWLAVTTSLDAPDRGHSLVRAPGHCSKARNKSSLSQFSHLPSRIRP